MRFELLHPRDQLVAIMNRIYHAGMTTLSGGNLSIREGSDLWITPAGVDKGKLSPGDILCVRSDGSVEGPHRPSTETPFHRAIYARRPDLGAIVHVHSPALVAFSIARQVPTTAIIPQAQRVCGMVGYAPYALPGSERLGERIAAAFGQGYNVVLLENHGVAAGGSDLLTAFQRLETLDFCARTLLKARGLGSVSTLTEEQLSLLDRQRHLLPEYVPNVHSSRERELRLQIVEIVHRACDRALMISTEGVASARIDERSFLITPTGLDRRGLEIEDVVLIQDGCRERGKSPSRSVLLHQAIYDQHPEIGSVITAQAPYALAYAITEARLDTKTIPESYLLLRDVPVVPYGAQFERPREIAAALSASAPVLLIRNDCVLTSGASLLQAFDRLEVADFTARSLLDTLTIGALVPIRDDAIEELKTRFLS